MAGQTTYNTSPDVAFPGMAVDNGNTDDASFTNEETAGLLAGILVCQGTADDDGLELVNAASDPIGVVMHQHNSDPDLAAGLIVAADGLGVVRRRGRVWVRCEEAIALGDRVFARHVEGGGEQKGEFRNDADGVSQVDTITPTAANDTDYAMSVFVDDPNGRGQLFSFEFTSDASGTATEIVTGFKGVMAADSVFTALVVATGTATLVLTAQGADLGFDSADTGVGILTVANTTAAAPDCLELRNCRWAGPSQTVNSVVLAPLDLNLV